MGLFGLRPRRVQPVRTNTDRLRRALQRPVENIPRMPGLPFPGTVTVLLATR